MPEGLHLKLSAQPLTEETGTVLISCPEKQVPENIKALDDTALNASEQSENLSCAQQKTHRFNDFSSVSAKLQQTCQYRHREQRQYFLFQPRFWCP